MKEFIKEFRNIVESASGALSFGLIQCLIMSVSVLKLSSQTGVHYYILLSIAVIATAGLALCISSIGYVIHEVTGDRKLRKLIFYILMYPSVIGVFVSATLTVRSMAN